MKKCPKCHKENSSLAVFCIHCGYKFKKIGENMKKTHYRNILSNGMETNLCPNISYHPILTDEKSKVTCEKCIRLIYCKQGEQVK